MTCIIEGCDRIVENRDNQLCATHNKMNRQIDKPVKLKTEYIRKISNERKTLENRYKRLVATWRKGKFCQGKFDHDCTRIDDITCHHMQGRVGYADEWARENDVPLLLDQRFWMPLCVNAHKYVTENSKWACENGYSFLRVTDPVFRKVEKLNS